MSNLTLVSIFNDIYNINLIPKSIILSYSVTHNIRKGPKLDA